MLVNWLVELYGPTREVVSLDTGLTHLVPTRLILERGIKGTELSQFPVKS